MQKEGEPLRFSPARFCNSDAGFHFLVLFIYYILYNFLKYKKNEVRKSTHNIPKIQRFLS